MSGAKPLELTIYPKDEHGDYIEGRFIHAVEVVEVYGYVKRLTDAELAAEYWRSREDLAYIVEGITWEAMVDEWPIGEAEALSRAYVLDCFATLPHYDEVSA